MEVEDDDDEEEMDDTAKAETVAYMQAFMQCTRTPSLPARTGNRGGLMRKAGKRAPDWDVALLRPGLECRSAVGSCKLRFVCRSEDLWLANVKRKAAKRMRDESLARLQLYAQRRHYEINLGVAQRAARWDE